jgi:hypothetical protein
VNGCGCLLVIALLVGGIVFMIFGSTDPGEPIAQAVTLAVALALLGMALVPRRRRLVRAGGA